jgi:hypothetical protein
MIGKSDTGRGFGGTLRYCLQGKKESEILELNGLYGNKANNLAWQFQAICDGNRRVNTPVMHTSLSFPKEDNITNEQMREIAGKFLEKAGFSKDNNQYIIIAHNDAKHKHVHIVANRVGYDGKAVSDSFCKSRTVKWSKELENDYKLTKVKNVAKTKEQTKPRDKVPIKEQTKIQLREAVDKSVNLPGVKNLQDLIQELNKNGIDMQVLKHSQTGKEYGVSFRLNDIAFKGSELGKKYAFKQLQNDLSKPAELTYEQYLDLLEQEKQMFKEQREREDREFAKQQAALDEEVKKNPEYWEEQGRIADRAFATLDKLMDDYIKPFKPGDIVKFEVSDNYYLNKYNDSQKIGYGTVKEILEDGKYLVFSICGEFTLDKEKLTQADQVSFYSFASYYIGLTDKHAKEYKAMIQQRKEQGQQKEHKEPPTIIISGINPSDIVVGTSNEELEELKRQRDRDKNKHLSR